MEIALPRNFAVMSSARDEKRVECTEGDSCPPSVETASDSSADSSHNDSCHLKSALSSSVKSFCDFDLLPSDGSVKKRVSFGELEVRKFPIILGDHPDVNGGPPLTIDWNFMASFKIPIDEFEMKRSGNRRKYTHLRLLPISRVQILQRSTDATPEEIEKATVEAYLFSYQRMRTLQNLLFHDMLKRSVKRLFRFGKKSSAETSRSLIVKASV